tara:strand:- start:213 stop:497 length:285 start_codon:yes stop_codon:yes gene_type:complete
MKSIHHKNFLILSGLLFAITITSDPLFHSIEHDNDLYHETEHKAQCELFNDEIDISFDKTFDSSSDLISSSKDLNDHLESYFFAQYSSRAPPLS